MFFEQGTNSDLFLVNLVTLDKRGGIAFYENNFSTARRVLILKSELVGSTVACHRTSRLGRAHHRAEIQSNGQPNVEKPEGKNEC